MKEHLKPQISQIAQIKNRNAERRIELKSVNNYMDRDTRTYAIIGAAMEVHRTVGPGHLEAVYQECLEIEFKLREIPFISQPRLEIFCKEQKLKKFYVPDFIIYNEVVVEIKAEKSLTKVDEAQLINSLTISRHSVGLLLNFGEESLRYRRFVS